MVKNLIILFLSILTIALAAVVLSSRSELRHSSGELAALQTENQRLNAMVIAPVSRTLFQLLSNKETIPIAMQYIRALQRNDYRSLISRLNLPAEKTNALVDILAERYAAALDATELSDSGTIDTAQGHSISTIFRNQLNVLLGLEDASLVAAAVFRPVSWDVVRNVDESLQYSGAPLQTSQLKPLMDIVASGMQFFSRPDQPADVETIVQAKINSNERVLQQAAALFTPEQRTALSTELENQAAALRLNLYRWQQQPPGTPTNGKLLQLSH